MESPSPSPMREGVRQLSERGREVLEGRLMSVIEIYLQPYGSQSKMRRMEAVSSTREAKEFLISKIVTEAQAENAPVSEIERKMLYFTESGWMLPDIMQVNEQFDREYDQDEYERKMAKIIAKVYRRILHGPKDEYDKWWAAVRHLRREDHYISVLIGLANLRPRWDQLKLLAAGLVIVGCVLFWVILSNKPIFFNK